MERRKFISSAVTAAIAVPAFSAFGKNNLSIADSVIEAEPPYDMSSTGTIVYKDGMPVPLQWFTDDRLSFEIDEMGVTSVIFFNPHTRAGNPFIFRRRLFDGFRLYLEQNHVTYSPKLRNYSFLPFGFSSEWQFNGIVVKYSIYAVQESIVFNLEIPDDAPSDINCKLEFYDSFALTPCDKDDFMFSNWGGDRKWRKWSFDPDVNALCNGFTEDPSGDITDLNRSETTKWHSFLNVCITADFDINHIVREQNVKRILRSKNPLEAGRSYSFIISFIPEEDAVSKTKIKLSGSSNAIRNNVILYREIAQQSPVLISPYKELNNFMALAPLFIEVLKVKAIPGAIRSNNILYWVWGWDGMTSNSSLVYWGDTECIRQMLQLYHKSADPVHGLVHAFRNDMTISLFSSTPSQAMYISLLYLYYSSTHDLEEVRKRYGFSVNIFEKILSLETRNTGFCRGVSLYPDFPKFMKETGNDASLFNNSLFYSAARSLECLAILMDDPQTRDKARAVFTRFEENFLPKYFNDEKNFFVSSIDAETLEQRDSYNLGTVKWDMGCFADLVDTVSPAAMNFIEKNMISNNSLREVPLWNESFDGDGNQLHCWFTANAQYFIRTANENNRVDLLNKFRGWVEYWTSQLTCPEAINYYAENSKPERERWNSMPGVWQMFGIKEWYLSVIHGIVGVDAGPGGITFYPYDGDEMILQGFNYLGKQFDIAMKGSGKYISEIDVDGIKYRGTNILPVDSYQDIKNNRIRVSVQRTAQKQNSIFIKSGYGIELYNYSCQKGKIKAKISGLGTCNLKLHAETEPVVMVNGKKAAVIYHADLYLVVVKLLFENNEKKEIEILNA